jgi:hypothetical protein
MRARRLVRLAPLVAVVVGCGRSTAGDARSAPADGGVAQASPAAITPAARSTVDAKGCVHDGRWRPCALVDRLEHAGLVVKTEKDTVRYDFLSVPGLRYTVGRGELHAFFYDDTTRLARDVAGVDTVRVAKTGTLRHWDAHPTFIRSGNLVVILLTLSEQLMERAQLAVQAGAPQPDPPSTPQTLPPAPATRMP